MTNEELNAIESRCNEATPGSPSTFVMEEKDATFIASARTDILLLVAEVRRLRNQEQALLDALDDMEIQADCQQVSELLAGNIVKEEFCKGELSIIRQIKDYERQREPRPATRTEARS